VQEDPALCAKFYSHIPTPLSVLEVRTISLILSNTFLVAGAEVIFPVVAVSDISLGPRFNSLHVGMKG